MKKLLFAAVLSAAFPLFCLAQRDTDAELDANPDYLRGINAPYHYSTDKIAPSPRGYKPALMYHFGRHCSRYCWRDYCGWGADLLDKGDSAGVLTPFGKDVRDRARKFSKISEGKTGDLSEVGWEEARGITDRMYRNFPTLFKGRSIVRAYSSQTSRCVLTMTSTVRELASLNPKMDIVCYSSLGDYPRLRPLHEDNPYRRQYRETPPDWLVGDYDFGKTILDSRDIYGKFFSDTTFIDSLGNISESSSWFQMMYAGEVNIPTDIRFDDMFTHEQLKILWEYMNYHMFRQAWIDRYTFVQPLECMVESVDKALSNGSPSVIMNFTHDTSMIPLMMMLGLYDMGRLPSDTRDVRNALRCYDIPMGCNLQFVLYTCPGKPSLIRLLLNEQDCKMPLESVQGYFYSWDDFKARVKKLTELRSKVK